MPLTKDEVHELLGGDFPDYHVVIPEEQRQIILLALFKLKRERPGWDYAISLIEQKFGGQIEWPEPESTTDGRA